MLNVSALLAFKYIKATRQIYKFSTEGSLPSYKEVKNVRCALIVFITVSITLFLVVCSLIVSFTA